MTRLICENVTLGYDGRAFLNGLSFSVTEGDYLCIVGENGAGKTTLMKTLLGLQPPMAGKIKMEGGLSQKDIGYLPQQSTFQRDFPASVKEIVLSGLLGNGRLCPFYKKEERHAADRAMEDLRIADLKDRCYRELSGGQQQKVLLARALCAAKKMILLDEPVAGLDPMASADMYRLIDRLHKENGITILMITHDISTAVHVADHILHVGKQVFFGTREEYLASDTGCLFTKKEGGAQ